MVIAKALAHVHQTPVQDQMLHAKSAWGILAEGLPENAAASITTSLGQAGVTCLVCPASLLVTLPDFLAAQRVEDVLAAPVDALSAAAIKVTTTTTRQVKEGPSIAQKIASTGILLATGMPIKIGGKERVTEKTKEVSDTFFYLDVISRSLQKRWRIEAGHFDYSFLKERKLYQVFGNFKLLLQDLLQKHPAALRNHGAHILVNNLPVNTMGYGSLAEWERETRWLLTLKALKERGQ